MRKLKTYGRVTLSVIGGLFFGLTLGAAILTIFMTQILSYELLTVQSDSMRPTLKRGDVVFVKPQAMKDIESGDIILFNEANTGVPFVHRVVAANEIIREVRRGPNDPGGPEGELVSETHLYQFVTKGDANEVKDGTSVTLQNFRGELWFSIPSYGLLGGNLPLQFILLGLAAAIGVLWLAFEYFTRSQKEKERRRKRKRRRRAPGSQRVGEAGSAPLDVTGGDLG